MIKKSIKAPFVIDFDREKLISQRYHTITKVLNSNVYNENNNVSHSIYVGSYGRNTAVNTSDVDILFEFPNNEFEHFNELLGDGQSRLLGVVRNALKDHYSVSDVRADGQVVKVYFTDKMKIEILPVFNNDYGGYTYPNADNGGRWMYTSPKIEQDKMEELNRTSNYLLFDTCRDMRYIRDKYFHSYHLAGIVIDSFVYDNIGTWQWVSSNDSSNDGETYEDHLLDKFYNLHEYGVLKTPGSNQSLGMKKSYDCLGKVLNKLNTQDWC